MPAIVMSKILKMKICKKKKMMLRMNATNQAKKDVETNTQKNGHKEERKKQLDKMIRRRSQR